MSSITTTTETLAVLPTTPTSTQPDISYHPNEAQYHARTGRRLAADPSLPFLPLPPGFPARVEGPIVWEGKDWTSEGQWVYRLSKAELWEIDDAVAHFKGAYRDTI